MGTNHGGLGKVLVLCLVLGGAVILHAQPPAPEIPGVQLGLPEDDDHGFDGQIFVVISLLISTAAMLFKSERDQKHALTVMRLQHEEDRREREAQARILAAAVVTEARGVRMRLEKTNADLTEKVVTSTRDMGARLEATAGDAQTNTLSKAIEEAKHYTAGKADAAYHEANDINLKLAKANKRIEEQGEILKQLLERIPEARP